VQAIVGGMPRRHAMTVSALLIDSDTRTTTTTQRHRHGSDLLAHHPTQIY
jgi:hypothetical protein